MRRVGHGLGRHAKSFVAVLPPAAKYHSFGASLVTVRSASTPPRALQSGVYVTAPAGSPARSAIYGGCSSGSEPVLRWHVITNLAREVGAADPLRGGVGVGAGEHELA